MSNKRVVVVGSGIAGIAATYFESIRGNTVTLIDSDARAGGLLKSDLLNGKYFDYGTHIFSQTGVKELDDFLFSGLNNDNCVITNKLSAANYFNGVMSCKNGYVDTSTLQKDVYKQGCQDFLENKELPSGKNLKEVLIQKFGLTFYKHIYKPLVRKYMGEDCHLLSTQVGGFFDMSRILAFDKRTTKELCEFEVYNEKLGHHDKEEGANKYYPKNGGVGKIINLLIEKLKQRNVDIMLATNITKIQQNSGVVTSVLVGSKKIYLDKLIWTLPSSYLCFLSGLNYKSTPPKFRKTGLYDFIFERALNSKANYINVYDLSMLSGRITLYQNLSKTDNYSCTVEVIADDTVKLDEISKKIKLELVEMGLICENNKCIFEQFRPIKNGFPILTTEFMMAQKKLSAYSENYFKNTMFVGRATGKVFFMNDILLDVYTKIMKPKKQSTN